MPTSMSAFSTRTPICSFRGPSSVKRPLELLLKFYAFARKASLWQVPPLGSPGGPARSFDYYYLNVHDVGARGARLEMVILSRGGVKPFKEGVGVVGIEKGLRVEARPSGLLHGGAVHYRARRVRGPVGAVRGPRKERYPGGPLDLEGKGEGELLVPPPRAFSPYRHSRLSAREEADKSRFRDPVPGLKCLSGEIPRGLSRLAPELRSQKGDTEPELACSCRGGLERPLKAPDDKVFRPSGKILLPLRRLLDPSRYTFP